MKLEDLNDLEKDAPKKGQYLIYTRQKVYFDDYRDLNELKDLLRDQQILEIHLFDEEKEYRALSTESKRFPTGVIEHLVSQKADDENAFIDETVIEGKPNTSLIVVNYLDFTDEGMAYIADYRLMMKENK